VSGQASVADGHEHGRAEAVFGHTADEVLGRRLDLLIPERLRSANWAAFEKAIDTMGELKAGPCFLPDPDAVDERSWAQGVAGRVRSPAITGPF